MSRRGAEAAAAPVPGVIRTHARDPLDRPDRRIEIEDEAGQTLRPPKGHTRAARRTRPVAKVRGTGGGRVGIIAVARYRLGDRLHLYHQLRVHRRRNGEP
jgi:hypothetical protein